MAGKIDSAGKLAPTSVPSEFTASGEFASLNEHGGAAWPKHEYGDPLAEFGGLQATKAISSVTEHEKPQLPSGKDKNPVSEA